MHEDTAKAILEQLKAIREDLAQIRIILSPQAGQKIDAEVLKMEEAIALSKKTTARQFGNWRRKFGVRPTGQNRFSRQAIILALNREAGNIPLPASLRKKITK